MQGGINSLADFTHLKVAKPIIGLMPQWNFLNFLTTQANKYPSFRLIKEAEVQDLMQHDGRITGVEAATTNGKMYNSW